MLLCRRLTIRRLAIRRLAIRGLALNILTTFPNDIHSQIVQFLEYFLRTFFCFLFFLVVRPSWDLLYLVEGGSWETSEWLPLLTIAFLRTLVLQVLTFQSLCFFRVGNKAKGPSKAGLIQCVQCWGILAWPHFWSRTLSVIRLALWNLCVPQSTQA